jgi:hypothetical protein
VTIEIGRRLINGLWKTGPADEAAGGGVVPFNGGTFLVEVLNEITLDNTGYPSWTFDAPYIDTTSGDVTLGADVHGSVLNINTDGWYQVWYSFAVKASATTVKAQVQSFIDGAPVGNMIREGSLGETQPHLDGAVSLGDLTTPFTSPPVPFSAGDIIRFRASATYTGGSVGNAILSTNTYVCIVRIA